MNDQSRIGEENVPTDRLLAKIEARMIKIAKEADDLRYWSRDDPTGSTRVQRDTLIEEVRETAPVYKAVKSLITENAALKAKVAELEAALLQAHSHLGPVIICR